MVKLRRLLSRSSSLSSDDSLGDFDAGAFAFQANKRGDAEGAVGGADNSSSQQHNRPLEAPVLVYHSCARSIVFRDSIRRASIQRSDSALSTGSTQTEHNYHHHNNNRDLRKMGSRDSMDDNQKQESASTPDAAPTTENKPAPSSLQTPTTVKATHFQPRVVPLPPLELGPNQEFAPLLQEDLEPAWTPAEQDVVERFERQTAVVKTILNSEWTQFLERFWDPVETKRGRSPQHYDVKGKTTLAGNRRAFNSFPTSTSLLPAGGLKMRCYGSVTQYTVGVVFALPTGMTTEEEDRAVAATETWAWQAGYAAKTEFNVDGRGKLINGRQEALAPLSVMRQYNDDYLNKEEYMVACRKTSGLAYIPYNEVYIRVGGKGRIVNGTDAATGGAAEPSFETGLGLPIALFVRTATYENLISLMRARARLLHVLGEDHIKGIPLLLITPENGVRVFTESLQGQFWKVASQNLNPFQNAHISHKTTSSNPDEGFMKQKMNELIDLDETIQERLTPEELAHIAGGFGATDESVEEILTKVMLKDKRLKDGTTRDDRETHQLQDVVNEGLVYAVRSGDYHCSRQLLILYSVVAARMSDAESDTGGIESSDHGSPALERRLVRSPDLAKGALMDLSTTSIAAPPPPPLDTDRLRSATNSDGLLAVLGAAQVLKCMKDGGAKRRVGEAISALEEWVEYGQHSAAFRITSWQNQRAAQGHLKIAMENNSNFMAFAGKKAITNRKTFAQRLRDATEATDFTDARFLLAIHEIICTLHSPCLRLELLQYVLGLDNRYSVAHVGRSVELAATCLTTAAAGREESD